MNIKIFNDTCETGDFRWDIGSGPMHSKGDLKPQNGNKRLHTIDIFEPFVFEWIMLFSGYFASV